MPETDGDVNLYLQETGRKRKTERLSSYDQTKRLIKLFKSENYSMIVHELGHDFTMDYLQALAAAYPLDEARELTHLPQPAKNSCGC
jgi:hypothetical protein